MSEEREATSETSTFPRWVSQLCQPRPIRMGMATEASGIIPETVPEMVARSCTKFGDKPYLCFKKNLHDPEWQKTSFREYYSTMYLAAKAMIALGLDMFHSVCIAAFNSPEWFMTDNAAIFAGGVAVGIYTTLKKNVVRHILGDCDCNLLFVDTVKQLHQSISFNDLPSKLHVIVQWRDELQEEDIKQAKANGVKLLSWRQFLSHGKDIDDSIISKRLSDITPAHCCTLIYTSGTTGPPKGAMISHDNLTWVAARMAIDVMHINENDYGISYLPLSHIAANLVELHVSMVVGGTVHFAQPDALQGSLIHTLRQVRPTLFLGSPRVYERLMEGARSAGDRQWRIVKGIGQWAKDTATRGNLSKFSGGDVPWGWWLADSVILNLVRNQLGLDHARILITAAAPLTVETQMYFLSLNLPLLDIYGCSEAAGPVTVTHPNNVRVGTSGQPFEGEDISIFEQDHDQIGEICARGRHIFMGYLHNPELSSQSIDSRGFYHTGDLGKIEDGHMTVKGRIKDIIVTAGGENVAPQPLEQAIVRISEGVIEHAVVVGDGRKHVSIVVATAATVPRDQIASWIRDVNTECAVSRAAMIKKFVVISHTFSEKTGELTSTAKVKRKEVMRLYSEEIDLMYDSDDVLYQVYTPKKARNGGAFVV